MIGVCFLFPCLGDGQQRSKMSSNSSSSSSMMLHSRGGNNSAGVGITNRRKAESCSFTGLLPVRMRSSSVIGQLGSPPPLPSSSNHELDQAKHPLQLKPYGNFQKLNRVSTLSVVLDFAFAKFFLYFPTFSFPSTVSCILKCLVMIIYETDKH